MITNSSSNITSLLDLQCTCKSGENGLPVINVSRSEPLMLLTTIAGISSAATIQAVQAGSYVGGPGQLMYLHNTAIAVAYAQNLKPKLTSHT